jgi:hypothetical protein
MEFEDMHDQIEDELSASEPPPLGTVVADAVATGTRMRRRRRLAVVASGGGALVVIATVAIFAAPYFASGGTPAPRVAVPAAPSDSPTTPPEKLAPGPSPTAKITVPPRQKLTSGAAVVALLRELVAPPGAISEVSFGQTDGQAYGSFLYDDGAGPATVWAFVATQARFKTPEHPSGYVGCERAPGAPKDPTCVITSSVTPGGDKITTLTFGPYPERCADDTKCTIKNFELELEREDGVFVTISAANGPSGHGRPATRAEPILSPDQMLTLAKDPRWGMTMPESFVDQANATIQGS